MYSILYAQIVVFILINTLIPILNNFDPDNKAIELFKNYYLDNRYKSFLLDFFIVYFILRLSHKLPLDIPIIYKRIIIILLFDIFLSIYLNNSPWKTGNVLFLKEWTLTVGWFAIIWDLIYYSMISTLSDKLTIKSQNKHLLIMSCIGFILLHL